MNEKPQIELKLNYKRTFLIGFAFFGILLLSALPSSAFCFCGRCMTPGAPPS